MHGLIKSPSIWKQESQNLARTVSQCKLKQRKLGLFPGLCWRGREVGDSGM